MAQELTFFVRRATTDNFIIFKSFYVVESKLFNQSVRYRCFKRMVLMPGIV